MPAEQVSVVSTVAQLRDKFGVSTRPVYVTMRLRVLRRSHAIGKGTISSKIKHAIKLKTSSARLAQLLQPSLAFCFSLQPMTAYRPVLDGTRAATVVF